MSTNSIEGESSHQRPLGVADFHVVAEPMSTVWTFTPKSEAAKAFVEDNVDVPDYMQLGNGAFAADHRMAKDLVEALKDNGFEVRRV